MKMQTYKHRQYESDDKTFGADAYKVKGYQGIAWNVLGWELEANEDTVWTGEYEQTGKVLAVMVGDDSVFTFEESDLTPIDENAFCHGCGQIGCGH
jgi:hypothetical protein